MTGQYLAEVPNVGSPTWVGTDADGNIIAYYINSTTGTMIVNGVPVTTDSGYIYNPNPYATPVPDGKPVTSSLELWNLTACMQQSFDWSIPLGSVYQWSNGLEWDVLTIPTSVNGVQIPNSLALGSLIFGLDLWSGNTLVLGTGYVSVLETVGYGIEAGFNTQTGALMWIDNRTGGVNTPYTRFTVCAGDGVYIEINLATLVMAAYSLSTGQPAWTGSLSVKMPDGNMPNTYDEYGIGTLVDTATGVAYLWGLGGDVWAVNMTNGNVIWTGVHVQANGPAGTETPYGIWPIWIFTCNALAGSGSGTMLYLSEGHEYSPPLFHGAQQLCLEHDYWTTGMGAISASTIQPEQSHTAS